MDTRYHSVVLDEEKCKGCTNCIKRCPTEAIRVRGGKAFILTERCIDCGECIRICENHAKKALADEFAVLDQYEYRVALPAPSLYAQFKAVKPGSIIAALYHLGFDEVYEVAYAAELTTFAIRSYLKQYLKNNPRDKAPLISASCPAVTRLLQVRFPSLILNLIPIDPPYLTAAKCFLREKLPLLNLPREKVGIFFISPCPAKITEIKTAHEKVVDGAFSFNTIFRQLNHCLRQKLQAVNQQGSGVGIGWARAGGENLAVQVENAMAVDGIHNVVALLEEIEMGKLNEIDYVEAMACPEGCVGGALTIENPFVARVTLRKLADYYGDRELPPAVCKKGEALQKQDPHFFTHQRPLPAKPILQLDSDLSTAIKKMSQLEKILNKLPGIDCGACGSPTCRSLAEDIVQEKSQLTDCIIILREQLEELAQKLLSLAQIRPPAMGSLVEKEGKNDP
ncbi:MAG: 4Fe-4S binding protein [Firmicutes bacterium]|nr:4Fe-4S binding protein [Bacillota bacterium]